MSGTLTIFDADGVIIPTHIDRYDTITLQPGSDIASTRLCCFSARCVEVVGGLLCEWEFGGEEYSRN